jgi:hypothetical protein
VSEIGLDVGQANELKLAFRKFDYTNGDVKSLTEGNTLGELRGVLRGTHKIVEMSLLEPSGTVTVPATTKPFVAKDNFKTKKDGGICSYLGDNFKLWFLGKIEEPRQESELKYSKLTRSSVDKPILAELGNTADVTLGEVFYLMEAGTLRKDAWYISYVVDANGNRRAVRVRWCGGGWFVYARSVGDPSEWLADFVVCSRNS